MGFVVILLSASTMFISRGPESLDTLSAQVLVPEDKENESAFLNPPFREFVHFMQQELDSTQTVGAAYTIVHHGEIVYTGTYGVRENGTQLKVDEHTLFRMASVSKGFAGVLATMLEQDGAFTLSDRVVEHYPGFLLKDSVSTADLTIKNLLSHTSGLVPYAFDNLVEADQDLYTIIERLDEVDISAPPGELYGYQNVMFSMLDPIARKATGIPYQVLLEEKIFNPLGMNDASAGPVDLEQNPNMAYPHVRTKKGYAPLHPHEGYYNVLPAAGVNASISDMGQWLLALLGYKPEWLPDTILNSISTPLIYTPLKWQYTRYWKPFRERYYSLGWRIYNYQGRRIIYHGGYIRGYRAEIAFCPSEDVGIAFMQNSPNNLASRCVPTFMDLFLE
jgi:beta-lactamase class C